MQPDPTSLMTRINLNINPIGFYDAPDPSAFEPLVIPGKGDCVFDYWQKILSGETLFINSEHYGCPGAANGLLNIQAFPKESLVEFLVDKEGLKASKELMTKWVDRRKPYSPEHGNIFIGPLKPDRWEYLKSVTFVLNPDQTSAVSTGCQYNAGPDDPVPVIAPFSSGCSLLVLFDDFNVPQGLVGAMDMAMREHIEPDQILFSVTKPMFEQLCALDEKSFLYKKFWGELMNSRGITV